MRCAILLKHPAVIINHLERKTKTGEQERKGKYFKKKKTKGRGSKGRKEAKKQRYGTRKGKEKRLREEERKDQEFTSAFSHSFGLKHLIFSPVI